MPSVFALGLDPEYVELPNNPELTPAIVRAFIEMQLDGLRNLGYQVQSCLVDSGATAEAVTASHLRERSFDCVLIGAGLRAPDKILLFEKLLNVVQSQAPNAKICFNSSPKDSAEAVQRWV
jgi:hypothetical protein